MQAKPTILVVEDNELHRALLSLSLAGYNVRFVKNGKAAITSFREEPRELIFLESKLPDMSGFELLNELKAINPKSYFVFVTDNNRTKNIKEALKIGAKGYIIKPFKKSRIIYYIEKYSKETYVNELS